jgi:hypothetical protein
MIVVVDVVDYENNYSNVVDFDWAVGGISLLIMALLKNKS